jgi:hypothetical protein
MLRKALSAALAVTFLFSAPARADLGADVFLDQPEMAELDPIVHANLAIGGRAGRLSAALELVTIATTGDVADGDDRFLHTATLGARYDLGRFAPSLAVTTGLDDAARGESIAITAGVGAAF